MQIDEGAFRRAIAARTDAEVHAIAYDASGAYTEAAKTIARRELEERSESGRNLVDPEPPPPPVATAPGVSVPVIHRMYLLLSLGYLAMSVALLIVAIILAAPGSMTTARFWSSVMAEAAFGITSSIAIIIAYALNWRHLRHLLIVATCGYLAVKAVEIVRKPDLWANAQSEVALGGVALVYLLFSDDLARYERARQAG